MTSNNTLSPPTLQRGIHFPSSRYPAIPLVRPLEVFGKAFDVELSSGLTLSPETVLRASLGKSLQTFLREEGLLQPLKQFRYGLLGQHQLSSTTKTTIRAAMGPVGDKVIAVLDGDPIPEELDSMSDWSALAMTWGSTSPDNALDVVVKSFVELDQFNAEVSACAATHGREAGEQMFQTRFGLLLPAWRELCPDLRIDCCVRLESSLHVVAALEAMPRVVETEEAVSLVAGFLDPEAKPLGHWLRQVAETVKCGNNKELADLLARRNILHHEERLITHDTLKGWSAMKPGSLMSLQGCQALLKVVPDEEATQRLLCRFALARFLAFLCDFLRSCVSTGAPTWPDAQRVILERYTQISVARQKVGGQIRQTQ
ncbi:hypothetical protein [Comamonas testosteroni]|uniref:hypothetical protein n=1 Tax=Comamonas testosteroni TaxID=285 RepID=UPI00076CCFC7|nr:hypothetical protein [Comamonas testosteroni]KWT69223.1 hypothetical protein APV28_2595 [Comamonas testosteroni]